MGSSVKSSFLPVSVVAAGPPAINSSGSVLVKRYVVEFLGCALLALTVAALQARRSFADRRTHRMLHGRRTHQRDQQRTPGMPKKRLDTLLIYTTIV